MKSNLPKRRLRWWPMLATRENETCLDEFDMSIAFLATTYFVFTFVPNVFIRIGILSLYFAQLLSCTFLEDLTRAQKWQTVAQQMSVALLLTSPLLYTLYRNWG